MSTCTDIVVDVQVDESEAAAAAARVVENLLQRGIILPTPQRHSLLGDGPKYARGPNVATVADFNDCYPCGLDITIGRGVYCAGENGFSSIACPTCGHCYGLDDIEWGDAVGAWCEKRLDSLMCKRCRNLRGVTEWRFDPVWAFGNLAFEFREWMLKKEFVAELNALLEHRVIWIHHRT